jgi:hypothetical protein
MVDDVPLHESAENSRNLRKVEAKIEKPPSLKVRRAKGERESQKLEGRIKRL